MSGVGQARTSAVAHLVALFVAHLVALGGCGDDGVALPVQPPAVEPVAEPEPEGDALLAEARASISLGAIDPAIEAKIMASSDPAHARAQRLLAAMKEPVPEDDEPPPADDPAIEAPPLPAGDVDPALPAEPEPEPEPTPAPSTTASSKTPTPAPSTVEASNTVSSVGLSSSGKGATLTIRGSGKLVVGTANQLSSGVVHLVLDRAKISPGALKARPKLEGVEVTRIRKGEGTVQISLELAPGWTLGSIDAFSGGARVHLQRPT